MRHIGTKAETLDNLRGLLTHSIVLPQLRFTVGDWLADEGMVLDRIDSIDWECGSYIVRSSALCEDSTTQSMAGHFCSVANVSGRENFEKAIKTVVDSLGEAESNDQFFIQPMLSDVCMSGVAFTRDPKNSAHYYVINYDDLSGDTDSITSGRTNDVRTVYVHKCKGLGRTGEFQQLLKALSELEEVVGTDSLDVEFAVIGSDLYILQVRPLILPVSESLTQGEQNQLLSQIENKVRTLSKPHPYLHGNRSVFGVMPDWNPAEIIGIRPHPLALSVYKELVTDSVWAYQRNNYGYRNLRSFPLLVSFSGLPYIDVRVSFNSFIPADINSDLAERLVNHYITSLTETPTHHDKVEFEIIHSCYTFDLNEKMKALKGCGFSDGDCAQLTGSLRDLTNKIIHDQGLWKADADKIGKLEARFSQVVGSDLSHLEKIYWLLEDCKRYGTLPFAGLARAGFIAVQLLRSMLETDLITSRDYEEFMASLDTVSSKMASDFGNLSKQAFLKKYGHLRPGTYDIVSARYDEAPDAYFDWAAGFEERKGTDESSHLMDKNKFSLSLEQMNKLDESLKQHQLDHGVISLFNFIKGAIEGREYAKFIFSRSLSEALRLLGELAEQNNISRDDMAFANIETVYRAHGSSDDFKDLLLTSIDSGKELYQQCCGLTLPPLIINPEDIYQFAMPANEPNYVTLKTATGKVVTKDASPDELIDAILMIPSADPGYDWVFTHKIAGFITMFGGTNSHMAIRAGELGIPAVIGAGEVLYRSWEKAKRLKIDCSNNSVQILA